MALAICAMTALSGAPAWAASAQSSFGVTARVESVCTASDARGRVDVRCTRGTAYNLSMKDGRARVVAGDGARLILPRDSDGVVVATIVY